MQRPAQEAVQHVPSDAPQGASAAVFSAARLIIDQALRGRPIREAIQLGIRLVSARTMSFVTLIVAAWLVDIETFAEFGVYQTLAMLASIALFLRYDAAIVPSKTEDEAGEVLRCCALIGMSLWTVFALGSVVAGISGFIRWPLAFLLPVSILARGVLCLSLATTTRDGDFKGIGRAPLIQSVVQPTILLSLVLSPVEDVLCFAIADIAGHVSSAAFLICRRRKTFSQLRYGWSAARIVDVARRWKGLPFYNLPSSFLSLAFVMSPLMVMPFVADPVFAGHVALAYRIFDVPTQIITAASTPIFLNKLKPSAERASPIFGRGVMVGLVVVLGFAYATMAGSLLFADPWLEGTELSGLADAVPLVAAFQLFVALAAPLNDSCSLYLQQKRLVLIQAMSLFVGIYAAFLATRMSPEGVLATLAVVSAFRALALGELLRKLSRLSSLSFVQGPLKP